MRPTIAMLNGPNLGRLGHREPERYGTVTLEEVEERCRQVADRHGVDLFAFHSNHEGVLIDTIEAWAQAGVAGVVVNAGALTHTSIALRDALAASQIPFIEVHITNVYAREDFRHISYVSDIAAGIIVGCGVLGYELAVQALVDRLGPFEGDDMREAPERS
ncbi:3-dehydroquinate dehydratase [Austwickia sp. TVS 96-490-7B]|uniref:type II 3-dehydroquinate dehydratase n=1 Tax=Austwickia sp. TVS 96-490-7B TaxID=2830843 RepID=UPI001C5624A7|nr:type II 3-dehydroquinate dehydratase [Austwickia sp. TVS 96-490-7B]MBW3085698.1 3-dehydroquinate dehydratase [Austwickia sp. TVS 96-490-7B]